MLREHLHTHLIKCNHFFASLLFQLSFTSIDLTNFFPRVYLLRKYIFENFYDNYSRGIQNKNISIHPRRKLYSILFFVQSFQTFIDHFYFSDINIHRFHLEKFKPHTHIYAKIILESKFNNHKLTIPLLSSKSTLEV